MFIGHFGVALAAERAAPRASLGTLFFATQLPDFLWAMLLLANIEHVRIAPGTTRVSPFDFYDYPASHSFLAALAWSALVMICYFMARRYPGGSWLLGLFVLSQWILDFVVHRPDLALWPGGPRVGLGLRNSVVGSVAAELLIFGTGLWIYLAPTKPTDTIGIYGFWSLMIVVFLGWVSSLFAGPPPGITSLAWGGIAMGLTVPWGAWADSYRTMQSQTAVTHPASA